ncbi:MAG: T9SS type A sorting domain-containing protein [Flavobacteriales bacterium]|nr:T9SS type A sorting domain-containing protein [Flavobacteriales bacterium]
MKKVLLTVVTGLFSLGMANAQCTPSVAYADSAFGLWPDSIPFITENGAYAGVDYSSVIDLKTFVDTVVPNPLGGNVNIKMDAFKIISITGQPAGFEWAAAGPTWNQSELTWYNGGAGGPCADLTSVQGCMSITADAAAVTAAAPVSGYTDYPLVVSVDARIACSNPDISLLIANGAWLSTVPANLGGGALAVNDYVLRVNATVGVAEMLNTTRFDVGQSYPNPATGETFINFNTPNSSTVEFAVYNMLGVVVLSDVITSEAGLNEYRFDAGKLASGMYVYTMRNNGSTVTKRLSVK